MRLLVYWPVSLLSDVFEFETVGPVEVFQQTPLAVTDALPSDVTFPPLVAVVNVIFVTSVVVNVGIETDFLHPLEGNNAIRIVNINSFFIIDSLR